METDEAGQQTLNAKEIIIGILLRVYVVALWCFLYIGLMWFIEEATFFQKLYGFTVLGLGLLAVILPARSVGIKVWFAIFSVFNILFYASFFIK